MRLCIFAMDAKAAILDVKKHIMKAYTEKAKYPSSKFFIVDTVPIDEYNFTPSVTLTGTYFQQYDAVLTWNSSGNYTKPHVQALCDYVDSGGSVVVCAFGTSNSYGLNGKWESGSYSPVTRGKRAKKSLASFAQVNISNSLNPKHPIFRNVKTFSPGVGGFFDAIVPKDNSKTLLSYTDGTPFIVERQFNPDNSKIEKENRRKAKNKEEKHNNNDEKTAENKEEKSGKKGGKKTYDSCIKYVSS